MSNEKIIFIILISAVITFLLRLLPFILFRKAEKMPAKISKLSKILPSAIMAVLIVYCLKDIKTDFEQKGIFQIIAALVTAVVYKLKHNTLAGILSGTAGYMILLRIFCR